jgi:sugar O-acyltransferase (sialic acid O-acetyltransferase NeuD family)
MKKTLPVLMIGAGGHAGVLLGELRNEKKVIFGVLDPKLTIGSSFMGSNVLGDDKYLARCSVEEVHLINGLGMLPGDSKRNEVFKELTTRGFSFSSVVSKRAIISESATLMHGAQVMAGAVIQPEASIGENAVVNTNSSIDHGSILEANVWVSPGVTVCGDVKIGRDSYISAGAIILQGVTIRPGTVVPAGTVVKAGKSDSSAVGVSDE